MARERGQAVLTVRDNGMGIEAELLPRVFDLFEQGERALDRNQGGLGVGLTLVQRWSSCTTGASRRTARGGEGAEFRVRLPCLAGGAARGAAAGDPAQPAGGCAYWWWTTTRMGPSRWRCSSAWWATR